LLKSRWINKKKRDEIKTGLLKSNLISLHNSLPAIAAVGGGGAAADVDGSGRIATLIKCFARDGQRIWRRLHEREGKIDWEYYIHGIIVIK